MANTEIICTNCSGSMTQKFMRRGDTEWRDGPCSCSGTREQIWNSLRLLLAQFIRCGQDGPFDPDNLESACEGCQFERGEVLNLVWHFARAGE